MMKWTTSSAFALASALACAQAQMAEEEPGFYLGAGYQYFDINTDTDFESVDDIGNDINALQVRAGYQFDAMFSLEAEGSFGISDGNFDFEGDRNVFDFDDIDEGDSGEDLGDAVLASGSGDIELDYLIGVYGRAQYPVTDRFGVHARLGYAFVQVEASGTLDGEGAPNESITLAEGDDGGVAFGVGATFDVTESWQLRADYTRYEFDDVDADGVGITLSYKFGAAAY